MDRVGAAPRVLITGAAGNLGSLLARHLLPLGLDLRLMYHRRPIPPELTEARGVRPFRADLRAPATLEPAVAGVDIVVHFAGVLFAPRPERFLPETNTRWFDNLLTASRDRLLRRPLQPDVWTASRSRSTRARGSWRSGCSSSARAARRPRRWCCASAWCTVAGS
jgi:nucleoside-diphosphate-sugar epimerase